MLTHMARVPSWVIHLEPRLLTATIVASDATQRTLGSLGTQAGSHRAGRGFQLLGLAQGGDRALARGAGLGSSCAG